MVTIPGGTFTLGSPANEAERREYEGPQNNVVVAGFAIGEAEVTRGQYAAFGRDTYRSIDGSCCTHGDGSNDLSSEDMSASWLNPAFERTADHPVVCVSWHDAKDFAAWLSRKTGQHYRLPSEAEWEYAARADTTSPFFWGASADRGCDYMNGGDPSLVRALPAWRESVSEALREGDAGARLLECDDGSPFTSAVGRYKPNAFGLYDMTRNVWEWVEDCWYESLPTSGRARIEDSCKFHRTREG